MKRIAKTIFPGKLARTGNTKYISVPTQVIERMGLKEGDYLDVTITWPEMQEYDVDEVMMPAETEDKLKRGRKPKTDE